MKIDEAIEIMSNIIKDDDNLLLQQEKEAIGVLIQGYTDLIKKVTRLEAEVLYVRSIVK